MNELPVQTARGHQTRRGGSDRNLEGISTAAGGQKPDREGGREFEKGTGINFRGPFLVWLKVSPFLTVRLLFTD